MMYFYIYNTKLFFVLKNCDNNNALKLGKYIEYFLGMRFYIFYYI